VLLLIARPLSVLANSGASSYRACVPPETRMFSPAFTEASRNRPTYGVSVHSATSSSRLCACTNMRMLTAMCRRVTSGCRDGQVHDDETRGPIGGGGTDRFTHYPRPVVRCSP
jgi:hypothetical protein